MLFGGLSVGKKVRLGPNATLRVLRGGRLDISDEVTIEANCQIVAEGAVTIGPRSFIGVGSIIVAVEQVTIGADALIAAYATIRDHDHRTDSVGAFNRQGLTSSPIEIGDNVWIGTKATILRGIRIGAGAVVGAHALVRSDVDPGSVVGGVPARTLKARASPTSLEQV